MDNNVAALRCARGFVMPVVILRVGSMETLSALDVHFALAFASMCAVIAGVPAPSPPLTVRAASAFVAAVVFVCVTSPALGTAALYVTGLHPWVGVLSHWHVSVQFTLSLVWAEALVVALTALCSVCRQARAIVFCVVGTACASAALLLAPTLIVAAAVHPLYRATEALGAAVGVTLLGAEHTAVRELMHLLAQFTICVTACVYVLGRGGIIPAAKYSLLYGAGPSVIELSAVDVLLSTYYPLFITAALAAPPPALNATGRAVLAAGEALDNLFVFVAALGPTLFANWFHVGVTTFFFTEEAAAALALACVYCAAFTLQFGVEELHEKAVAMLRRARAARRSAPESQSLTEFTVNDEEDQDNDAS